MRDRINLANTGPATNASFAMRSRDVETAASASVEAAQYMLEQVHHCILETRLVLCLLDPLLSERVASLSLSRQA